MIVSEQGRDALMAIDLDNLAAELAISGFMVEREDGYIVCEGWWIWPDGSVSKPAKWSPTDAAWTVCDLIRRHIARKEPDPVCATCGHIRDDHWNGLSCWSGGWSGCEHGCKRFVAISKDKGDDND